MLLHVDGLARGLPRSHGSCVLQPRVQQGLCSLVSVGISPSCRACITALLALTLSACPMSQGAPLRQSRPRALPRAAALLRTSSMSRCFARRASWPIPQAGHVRCLGRLPCCTSWTCHLALPPQHARRALQACLTQCFLHKLQGASSMLVKGSIFSAASAEIAGSQHVNYCAARRPPPPNLVSPPATP